MYHWNGDTHFLFQHKASQATREPQSEPCSHIEDYLFNLNSTLAVAQLFELEMTPAEKARKLMLVNYHLHAQFHSLCVIVDTKDSKGTREKKIQRVCQAKGPIIEV